jgi:hypothetical protein
MICNFDSVRLKRNDPHLPAGLANSGPVSGEENTARIRQEVECAVYHLPWLSPAAMETEERKIDRAKEPSTVAASCGN